MVFPEVSPDQSHLCAHNNEPKSDAINCFVRHTDGSLDTSVATETTPLSQPSLLFYVITSDSTYVVATDGANQVLINSVASSTNPGTGNKVSSGGQTPIGIARTGQWIAVANQKSNTISIFTVNSAGQLMQAGSPVNTVSAPFRMAFSQNGNYLFVSSDSGMESFQFNTSTAALSPLNGRKAVAGTARAIAAQ
ncbi:MAG TPA: beta-propeller fold lactonase family protein [Terriglobales bacterium]|nr:beta-propeller fold lactonase family protein [Terriglobales bacterium]